MGTDLSPKIHDQSPFLDLRPPGFYPLAGQDIPATSAHNNFYIL